MFIETVIPNDKKRIDTAADLNCVLGKIIGDYMHKLYFDKNSDEDEYRLSWALQEDKADKQKGNDDRIESQSHSKKEEQQQRVRDYTMRDLFLWSILMNRIDMAKVLLCHVKYRICAALIATKILKEYHKIARHGDLKNSYMENANYFEQYAINCINQCEKNDPELACQIVLQQIELYGNVTCLQVS